MRNRNRKLDVTHAVAADAGNRHLDATAIADDALVLDSLVLSAGALPVARGSEYLLAEETVPFGAVGAVVDCLRIADLAMAPAADHIRRGQRDADGIILVHIAFLVENFFGNKWVQSFASRD